MEFYWKSCEISYDSSLKHIFDEPTESAVSRSSASIAIYRYRSLWNVAVEFELFFYTWGLLEFSKRVVFDSFSLFKSFPGHKKQSQKFWKIIYRFGFLDPKNFASIFHLRQTRRQTNYFSSFHMAFSSVEGMTENVNLFIFLHLLEFINYKNKIYSKILFINQAIN